MSRIHSDGSEQRSWEDGQLLPGRHLTFGLGKYGVRYSLFRYLFEELRWLSPGQQWLLGTRSGRFTVARGWLFPRLRIDVVPRYAPRPHGGVVGPRGESTNQGIALSRAGRRAHPAKLFFTGAVHSRGRAANAMAVGRIPSTEQQYRHQHPLALHPPASTARDEGAVPP